MTAPPVGLPILADLQATTLVDVQQLLAVFSARWRVPTYLLVAHISVSGNTFVPRALTNVDSRFAEDYQRNAWGLVDQVNQLAMASTVPVRFSLDAGDTSPNEWAQAAHSFGLDRGLAIPLFGPRRQTLALQLHVRDLDERLQSEVETLCSESLVLLTRLFPVLQRLLTLQGPKLAPLSAIEHTILSLIANGKCLKVIAATLGLSMKSISNHLHSICVKWKVGTRDQALGVGAAAGVITMFRTAEADDDGSLGLDL